LFLDADQLIQRTRRKILDPANAAQGNTFFDDHILEALELAFDELVLEALDSVQGYAEVVRELNLSANTANYPLYDDFLRLRLAERQPGGSSSMGSVMAESRRLEGEPFGVVQLTPADHVYALVGDEFVLDPVPAVSETAGVKLYIVTEPPPPLKGTAQGGGASAITLATTAPDVDDQLNGSWIRVISGPGVGERRRVSDYVGSTRVATVSAAWGTQPTNASVYATVPRLPSIFHPALTIGAAMHARDDLEMDSSALRDHWNAVLERWAAFLETRTQAPMAEGMFDLWDGHA
jgi:hypothetical protein